MGTRAPVVSVRSIYKTYRISRPPRVILKNVSLDIHDGEMVAIMGPSGCGKSTLLHIMGGLEPPDSGEVLFDNRSLYRLNDRTRSALRRDRIGFVFQSFNLIATLTAAENVGLPLRLGAKPAGTRHLSPLGKKELVHTMMNELNLHNLQGHGPDEISGGEQQRIALARALITTPRVVLADEPTGSLDWTSGHDVMGLLAQRCHNGGQTTALVTHDARIAAYADRVLLMRDGEILDEVALHHPTRTDWNTPPDAHAVIERLVHLGM